MNDRFLVYVAMASLELISFNMRGFSNGCNLVKELLKPNSIIAVQEHWLRGDNMSNFAAIDSNVMYYGVSGMNNRAKTCILQGRPFGGVAFIWNRSISRFISIVGADTAGRCCAIKVNAGNRKVLVVNVYFPCQSQNTAYVNEISECLGFIDNLLNNEVYTDVVIMGDTNFECSEQNVGFCLMHQLLSTFNIWHCDGLMDPARSMTYVNDALGHKSCLDHIFVSDSMKDKITLYDVLLLENNFSDHRPIRIGFDFGIANIATKRGQKTAKHYVTRWDKCSLSDYYEATRASLADVVFNNDYARCADNNCRNASHLDEISCHYSKVVAALTSAAEHTVPKIPCNSLHPFWNSELDELKSKSVFWHQVWKSAGAPESGWLHNIKTSCKFKYKLAIKQAVHQFENAHTDEIDTHFMAKNMPEFWKAWSKKFHRSLNQPQRINGLDDNLLIAEEFATHFSETYDKAADPFTWSDDSCDNNFEQKFINFELIDSCMRNLKLGRAGGPDGLMAEHLIHAHPSLLYHLCILFRSMATHSFVPQDFAEGIIVPLVKDKTADLCNVNNYRGITLTPVISKLFESILLHKCDDVLLTDDLQFGFKKSVGCPQAVFTLRTVVEYFNSKGSTVFAAALDISKAFDTVSHSLLFKSLIKAGVPIWIVKLLVHWYGKLCVAVRWNGAISQYFAVKSGVRQGSILSPSLFTVFMNIFIIQLKECGDGCTINNQFVGCIVYADDIIILSCTIGGLQHMLDMCQAVAVNVKLTFNCKKSVCISFGPGWKRDITNMLLGAFTIDWCQSVKYLGVSLQSYSYMKVDTDVIKRRFFASCNTIISNSTGQSELVRLSLVESYCLPVLQYCCAAFKLLDSQVKELNACWNMAYRRIFGFSKHESVKEFIGGMGRLNFKHIMQQACVKFCKNLSKTTNVILKTLCSLHVMSSSFKKICYDFDVNVDMSFGAISKNFYTHFRESG